MSPMPAPGRAFVKMHGLGNDFVIFDARETPLALTEPLVRAIADRRRGIGCDLVTVVGPGDGEADASLRFYNADGGEAEACGNATRCVGFLLMRESGKAAVTLATKLERLTAKAAPDGRLTVDMGNPRFGWADVPLAEPMDTARLDLELGPRHARVAQDPSALSMGNPHCVFFVDELEAINLEAVGPLVEHHPLFPERTNVGFARLTGSGHMRLRVWERGAGITEACGSGACAAVVAAARRGLGDRHMRVQLDGGELEIHWTDNDRVLMTGPVSEVFEGMVVFDEVLESAR